MIRLSSPRKIQEEKEMVPQRLRRLLQIAEVTPYVEENDALYPSMDSLRSPTFKNMLRFREDLQQYFKHLRQCAYGDHVKEYETLTEEAEALLSEPIFLADEDITARIGEEGRRFGRFRPDDKNGNRTEIEQPKETLPLSQDRRNKPIDRPGQDVGGIGGGGMAAMEYTGGNDVDEYFDQLVAAVALSRPCDASRHPAIPKNSAILEQKKEREDNERRRSSQNLLDERNKIKNISQSPQGEELREKGEMRELSQQQQQQKSAASLDSSSLHHEEVKIQQHHHNRRNVGQRIDVEGNYDDSQYYLRELDDVIRCEMSDSRRSSSSSSPAEVVSVDSNSTTQHADPPLLLASLVREQQSMICNNQQEYVRYKDMVDRHVEMTKEAQSIIKRILESPI